MPINAQFDAAMEINLITMRVEESTRRQVRVILKDLESTLVAKVNDDRITNWSRQRIQKQTASARQSISRAYTKISEVSREATKGIATPTASLAADALSVTALTPPASVLNAIANGSIIQGATQGAWWRKQSGSLGFKYTTAVSQGIAGGEATGPIISRVRGLMDVSRRDAAALVQTSMQTVMNNSKMATFKENESLIKKYRAVTALDSHVCRLCIPYADLEWQTDGEPIGHSLSMPVYPIHFNDRCTMIPVVLDGPQGGQRASEDGPVKGDTTLAQFMKRKGTKYTEEMLGKGKAKLWADGKISLQDLTNGANRELTLQQLGGRTKAVTQRVAARAQKKAVAFKAHDNSKDAATWAKARGYAKTVDFGKLDASVANEINKSAWEHQRDFPELFKDLGFIGSGQVNNREITKRIFDAELRSAQAFFKQETPAQHIARAKRRTKTQKMSGEFAHSVGKLNGDLFKGTDGVSFNEKWGQKSGIGKMESALIRDAKSGFSPISVDTVKATMDHELGHQLDNLLKLSADSEIFDARAAWIKAGNTRETLGGYAMKNKAEFIAEAWAEYRNNPKPRATAKKVGDIINARYKAKFESK
mgnify:CR=1 FL=1